MLDRFGDLRIILAHFYFLSADIERARKFLAAHPSVKFDITPGKEMYENFAAARDAYMELFTDRAGQIVFGTDHILTPDVDWQGEMAKGTAQMRRFLETDDKFEHWGYELHGLALPREALEKIYRANFIEFYGDAPKPVNIPATVELGERLIADLKRSNADQKQITLAKDMLTEIKTF